MELGRASWDHGSRWVVFSWNFSSWTVADFWKIREKSTEFWKNLYEILEEKEVSERNITYFWIFRGFFRKKHYIFLGISWIFQFLQLASLEPWFTLKKTRLKPCNQAIRGRSLKAGAGRRTPSAGELIRLQNHNLQKFRIDFRVFWVLKCFEMYAKWFLNFIIPLQRARKQLKVHFFGRKTVHPWPKIVIL